MDTRPILLVEDHPDDIVLTLRAFEKMGIHREVVVVRDGAEALDYLRGTGAYIGRNPQELPALVLLDLKLPRVDGHEFLEALQADPVLRAVRVVVLTSSLEHDDIVQSYAHGACSYIRKPVEYERFLVAIGQLGHYWLQLNETPTLPAAVVPC